MLNTLRAFLIILLCFLTVFSLTAFAVDVDESIEQWSGISDGGLMAELYSIDGDADNLHLIISGTGEMNDFSSPEQTPWHEDYSQRITKVTLCEGVSKVGENSFLSLVNLSRLYVENPTMEIPITTYNIIPEQTVIYGHINSTAKVYADWYMRLFRPICRFSNEPCSVCGYECSEPYPICTPGFCPVCGTTHADNIVHVSNGIFTEEIPPECEKAGVVSHANCIHCDIPLDAQGNPIYDLVIPPLSHSLNWNEEVSPSCENPGRVGYFSCRACSKIFDANINEISKTDVVPTGHTGGAATCVKRALCDVCGKEYGELNTDNHGFSAGSVYNGEWHANSCACGAVSASSPHIYKETVLREPTEFLVGEKEKICECGYRITEEIPRLSPPEIEIGEEGNSSVDDENDGKPKILRAVILSVFGVALATAILCFAAKRILGKNNKFNDQGEEDV